ncbi:hypothetical protein PENSPDRAFT_635454 [Peniophora sp. CONT]|nr:hypothetical protein PENSPDRAFT_635454 [Peniophora sp. CONT]
MIQDPAINPQGDIPKDLRTPLDPDLYNPTPDALAFLKQTVSPDENEIRSRVEAVQKEAYDIYAYPCIRGFRYVAHFMKANAAYSRAIELGKADPSAILLDIGCCMGTDVRKAAYDGYPASQIVGCELQSEFIRLGKKLYADEENTPIRFIQGDVLTLKLPSSVQSVVPSSTPVREVAALDDLLGRVAVLYTGALFHLFDESTQHALALRLALLARQDKPTLIFGRHQGQAQAGPIKDNFAQALDRYAHSSETWVALWKQVFTTVRGEEFARDNVIVKCEFDETGFSADSNVAGRTQFGVLYWSVEISP